MKGVASLDLYRILSPLFMRVPPEAAHRAVLWALRLGLGPRPRLVADPVLRVHLWGRDFPNPIGLAAGFDKNAEAVGAMLALGFGFVEVGTVTPRPQPGNPRPRVFRLPEDRAIINRMGFNSDGMEKVAARLARRPPRGIVGVNVGRNRDGGEEDYAAAARRLAPFADYLVLNVSSPNTPGLRDLQEKDRLASLIKAVTRALAEAAAGRGGTAPPLLLKIAPDLTHAEIEGIAGIARAQAVGGIIVSNTTVARPASLKGRHRDEAGGLSGAPLFAPSTEVLRAVYRATGGGIPLVGVGGVASGADAYLKIRAGASLVQLYTALVYEGPGLVARIAAELARLLRADGYSMVAQAVGADAGQPG